jgi:hypothetical protein
MLTITDFINILRTYYRTPSLKMEEIEEQKLEKWRSMSRFVGAVPGFCATSSFRIRADCVIRVYILTVFYFMCVLPVPALICILVSQIH